MFVELMPLLADRTVLITVAKVDDKTLRVNVIPHGKADDDNPALSTPLTFTGPPEELDAELGKHLASYVQTHAQTTSTLAEAKATMEAAAKAAQEDAKRKKATLKPAIATMACPVSTPATATAIAGHVVSSPPPMETLGLFPPVPPESAPTQ
jgi:PRTRC genetic system protein E